MNSRILRTLILIALGGIGAWYYETQSGSEKLASLIRESESVSRKITPTPTVTISGTIPTPQIAAEDSQQIRQLIEQARTSLPKKADLRRKTSEEMHTTPLIVLEAGKKLGELAEFLDHHPESINQCLPLYRDCALDTDGIESIRAVCTFRLSQYEKNWDTETREAFRDIAPEIRELAKKLEGTD